MILVLTGCGRIGFDPFGSASVDAAKDGVSIDVGNGGENAPAACLMNQAYTTRPGLTNRYREGTALVTWSAARDACIVDGADLWVPNTALEAMTLTGDWVGITDAANEGVWLTVKGMPATFLPWDTNQPDGGTQENCGRNQGTTFEDRDCSDLRDYVCECD